MKTLNVFLLLASFSMLLSCGTTLVVTEDSNSSTTTNQTDSEGETQEQGKKSEARRSTSSKTALPVKASELKRHAQPSGNGTSGQ